MKKVALLLSVLFIAACGGGGSGGTTASGTPTTGKDTGTVTVSINEAKQTAKLYNYTASATNYTWRRVVVTNPSLDDPASGRVFKQYYDYRKDNPPTLSFNLPYASGYLFEFLEYSTTPNGGFKTYTAAGSATTGGSVKTDTLSYPSRNILKYAKAANVNVGSGGATVQLTPVDVPDPIISFPVKGLKFNSYSGVPSKSESASFEVKPLFTNIPDPSMFNANKWRLQVRKRSYGDLNTANYTTYYDTNQSGTAYVPSLLVWASNEVEMRGHAFCYLNDSILLPNEPYTKFTRQGSSNWLPVVVRSGNVTIPQ